MENSYNERLGFLGLVTKDFTKLKESINIYINSSLVLRKEIRTDNNPQSCMVKLLRDSLMCNLFLRFIGYKLLTAENYDEWDGLDARLNKYISKYFNDSKFNAKLFQLYEFYNNKNNEYSMYLSKMITKCNNTIENSDTLKMIKIHETKITNILSSYKTITIDRQCFDKSLVIKSETDDNKKIKLNYANYINLIGTCNDIKTRQYIENIMFSLSESAMIDFSKLILCRKLLANEAKYPTYFHYIRKNMTSNDDHIKELISGINKHIDKKLVILLDKINRPNNVKLTNCDIYKHIKDNKNTDTFELSSVIISLIKILEQYFSIQMRQIKNIANKYEMYEIYIHNKLMGRLFLDIAFNINKKLVNPLAMLMTESLEININNKNNNPVPEMMIIGNYKPSITYNEIMILFKEFGNIVSNICYKSKVGLLNYDEEYTNFFPLLFEYIVYDTNTIKMIISNDKKYNNIKNISVMINHILLSRDIEICYGLKIRCINAKFDHLLHNSLSLLNIITKAIETKGHAKEEILQTYKNIYTEFMSPLSKYFQTEIECIDPQVLMQQISGYQGQCYAKLMNEILAFGCYWLIINNKKKNIVDLLIHDGITPINIIIKKILTLDNNDESIDHYFNLFITEVIKSNVADDTVTDTAQYFEDIYGDDDSADVIEIRKI
uniref:Uncharacterized protein n=1 Tax=viral metagenome TaxID=1070528 RepID=A0A6C0DZF4_9ZZZZ